MGLLRLCSVLSELPTFFWFLLQSSVLELWELAAMASRSTLRVRCEVRLVSWGFTGLARAPPLVELVRFPEYGFLGDVGLACAYS